ncbi:hypothetical protein L1987_35213 [Smallanthus sonchifolius]|uniref:Uncharacterized protein n=1 Tax=Smallanthus sonchifolius TaxID=185202 RepID=A0ACB9HX63_9ASTR|nr:hypothetical protein L1987_35213 [Smallanthus sonchifolius]
MDTDAGSMDLNQESKFGEEEDDGEVFRILGYSMCLKRRGDSNGNTDSASSHTLSKRRQTEQNRQGQTLESRRHDDRAWRNSMDLNKESKSGGEEDDGEVFRILGHSMCLKRRSDSNSNTD